MKLRYFVISMKEQAKKNHITRVTNVIFLVGKKTIYGVFIHKKRFDEIRFIKPF